MIRVAVIYIYYIVISDTVLENMSNVSNKNKYEDINIRGGNVCFVVRGKNKKEAVI